MDLVAEIKSKVARVEFEFSKHADDQSIIRSIGVQEIREAISQGEIIEDYPNDKYGPSCLILGYTRDNRPLHVQCSYPTRALVKVITGYHPDQQLWTSFRVRKEGP